MKRIYFLLLFAIVAFTACNQDDYVSPTDLSKGKMTTVTVGLDNVSKTRAAYADPELKDMRVVLTVTFEGTVVHSEEKIHDFNTNGTLSFDLRLVSDQEYAVSCWADFGDDYYTINNEVGGIPTVEMNSYGGSDNKRDAYFGIKTDVKFDGNSTTPRNVNLTLIRPFGLVKVTTTDYNVPTVKNGFRPSSYEMTLNVPTSLSLATGELGTADLVVFSGEVSDNDFLTDSEKKELSFDYIFAAERTVIPTIAAKYIADKGNVNFTFNNIPVQRNYKTNISGNILTKNGNVNVDVDNDWEDEENDVRLITTTDDAKNAIESGANTLVLSSEAGQKIDLSKVTLPETGLTIIVEHSNTTADINFHFPENYSAPVNINAGNNANSLTLSGGSANNISVTGKLSAVNVTNTSDTGTMTVDLTKATSDGLTLNQLIVAGGGTTSNNVTYTVGMNLLLRSGSGTRAVSTRAAADKYPVIVQFTASEGSVAQVMNLTDYNVIGLYLNGGDFELNNNIQVSNQTYYFPITKDGFFVKGVGETKSVLYGKQETTNGGSGSQSLVAVIANGVTLENVTLMPKKEISKTVEVLGADFKMKNCELVPNTIMNYGNNSGYAWVNADNASFDGCTFKYAGLEVRENITADVRNSEFNYGSPQSGWSNACLFSYGVINTANITINNCANPYMVNGAGQIYEGGTLVAPIVPAANEKLVDQSITATSGTYMVGVKKYTIGTNAFATISAAMTAAVSGDVIKLVADTYGNPTNITTYKSNPITVKVGVTLEGVGDQTVVKMQLRPLAGSIIKNLKMHQVKASGDAQGGMAASPIYAIEGGSVAGAKIQNVTFTSDNTGTTYSTGETAIYTNGNIIVDGCRFANFWKGIFCNNNAFTVTNNTFTRMNPISFICNYGNQIITGNTFDRNSTSDTHLVDLSPADFSEIAYTTSGFTYQTVNNVTKCSENLANTVSALRANNTWTGSSANNKPIMLRRANSGMDPNTAMLTKALVAVP